MQPLLLLMAFLLPPGLGQPLPSPHLSAFSFREITGGHEAKPHSCPYMALLQFLGEKSWKRCGASPWGPTTSNSRRGPSRSS
ncbi:hypothetical protein FD754_024484, partial [Muntiacus muntjak]